MGFWLDREGYNLDDVIEAVQDKEVAGLIDVTGKTNTPLFAIVNYSDPDIAVVGGAGNGKSTLVRTIRRIKLSQGYPEEEVFVDSYSLAYRALRMPGMPEIMLAQRDQVSYKLLADRINGINIYDMPAQGVERGQLVLKTIKPRTFFTRATPKVIRVAKLSREIVLAPNTTYKKIEQRLLANNIPLIFPRQVTTTEGETVPITSKKGLEILQNFYLYSATPDEIDEVEIEQQELFKEYDAANKNIIDAYVDKIALYTLPNDLKYEEQAVIWEWIRRLAFEWKRLSDLGIPNNKLHICINQYAEGERYIDPSPVNRLKKSNL